MIYASGSCVWLLVSLRESASGVSGLNKCLIYSIWNMDLFAHVLCRSILLLCPVLHILVMDTKTKGVC